jgi:hypothetical protein
VFSSRHNIVCANNEYHNLFCTPRIYLGGCGLDFTGSGQGPVVGCCECGDEPSGSCATELVRIYNHIQHSYNTTVPIYKTD